MPFSVDSFKQARLKPHSSGSLVTFWQFGGPLWDPKIDQKLILGPKKGARKRFFIDFSSDDRFSHFRAWIFINFGWKFDQKIDACFQNRALFFQPGDPLNLCTGAVFWALFTFFVFFWKLWQNWPKNTAKSVSKKNIEKWGPWGPRIDPKWLRINRKNHENRKKYPKSMKIEGPIFGWFFGWPKNFFRRVWHRNPLYCRNSVGGGGPQKGTI